MYLKRVLKIFSNFFRDFFWPNILAQLLTTSVVVKHLKSHLRLSTHCLRRLHLLQLVKLTKSPGSIAFVLTRRKTKRTRNVQSHERCEMYNLMRERYRDDVVRFYCACCKTR